MRRRRGRLFKERSEIVKIKRNEDVLYSSIKMMIRPVEGKFDTYHAVVQYPDANNKNIKKGDIVLRQNGDVLTIKRVSPSLHDDSSRLDLVEE